MGSESSHPRQAEILDQLSLFQFLQGKLPEAEMHARRSLVVIQDHFEIGDPAVCMCELRLGAILFSMLPLSCSLLCLVTMTGVCCLVAMTGACCLVTMTGTCCLVTMMSTCCRSAEWKVYALIHFANRSLMSCHAKACHHLQLNAAKTLQTL